MVIGYSSSEKTYTWLQDGTCWRMLSHGLLDKQSSSRKVNEVKEGAMWLAGWKAFQLEGNSKQMSWELVRRFVWVSKWRSAGRWPWRGSWGSGYVGTCRLAKPFEFITRVMWGHEQEVIWSVTFKRSCATARLKMDWFGGGNTGEEEKQRIGLESCCCCPVDQVRARGCSLGWKETKGVILQMGLTGFISGLDVRHEKKRGNKDDIKGFEDTFYWESEHCGD